MEDTVSEEKLYDGTDILGQLTGKFIIVLGMSSPLDIILQKVLGSVSCEGELARVGS